MYAIETTNLTKKYKTLTAVNNLNLKVEKGKIFGLYVVKKPENNKKSKKSGE